MPIETPIRRIVAAVLLLTAFGNTPAETPGATNSGNSAMPEQPASETPTTSPGKNRAEGADNSKGGENSGDGGGGEFVPSETISADSAIAFPVDI
ncbi:MAG: hypothetical protein GTO67_00360 [Gammaproteobacteria bacterium]|nr:hypothetical protein [Gammaproteobacteria bacterium]NIN37220.1 hypothetical protein [Gammaproteobacteria bacterium]NIO26078.1 hypothetical protein [Gammaproteobacteria bacterium]NIO66691.1 hypothetical protein [Gammaproteobacteria bacterium]NIP46368.1 hypothetical protein [Gammaproteobacteria bacterium]